MTEDGGAADAVARWRMPMSWISAPGYRVPGHGPIQLITTPEGSLYHQIAAAALHRAGRKFEIVCKSANFDVLRTAVDSGYGVAPFVAGLAPKSAQIVPASQLAGLPDVTLGLFARESAASASARPAGRAHDRSAQRLAGRRPGGLSRAQRQKARAFGVQPPTPLATMLPMTAQT